MMRKTVQMLRARALAVSLALCVPGLAAAVDNGTAPVTLEEAVQTALTSGPDARASRTALEIAQAQYAQAKAGNALGLAGTAAGNYRGGSVNSASLAARSGRETPSDSIQAGVSLASPATTLNLTASHRLYVTEPPEHASSVSLSASQTLWDGYRGGRSYASVQQAQLSVQSSGLGDQDNRRSIVTNVSEAYYALLAAQRVRGLREQTIVQRREELNRVQAMYDANGASAIDLKQAEVNLASAEMDLAVGEDSVDSQRQKLSLLLGWLVERQYTVADAPDLPLPELDPAAAVSVALQQRVDLRQLRISRSSEEIDLAVRRAQHSPTVTAGGSVAVTREWQRSTDSTDWNLNLSVSVPVADAGLARAQISQAILQTQATEIQEQQLVASITAEVRDAVAALKTLVGKTGLARQSLELAEAQYELAQVQLASGAASPLDLLEASVNLSSARVALSEAQAQVQLGILSLRQAMGQ